MNFNNIKLSILLLPFIAMMMFSCVSEPSADVRQDAIYAEYRLVYSSDDDKTYARANFKLGSALGTKLELTSPAVVSFEGSQLAWKGLLAYYERDQAGVTAQGEFEYTDLDGNTFRNSVKAAKSIDLPANLDSLKKGAAFTLTWIGDPVGPGETINVAVNGPNEGDARIFTTSNPGATSIILEANKINQLGIGTGKIVIERYHSQSIQQGTSKGGASWARYYSKTENIQIVN